MNLENTKLDLSGYAEEERKVIAKAYADACALMISDFTSIQKYVFCSKHKNLITNCSEKLYYFNNNENTEVKPIKKEEWLPIKSLDDLKVGDAVRYSYFNPAIIVYKGVSCYAEHCNGKTILDKYNAHLYKKLSTTYTFEPVQDDSLAIECFASYMNSFNHFPVDRSEFYNIRESFKQAWRAVAELKLQQK